MSSALQGHQTRTEKAVEDFLSGLDRMCRLAPGAKDRLRERFADYHDAERALTDVFELLESEAGSMYLNPEYQADGKPEAPLRLILKAMPIKDDQVERLYREWGPEYLGVRPSRVLASVWGRLQGDEGRAVLRETPAPSVAETRVREALGALGHYFKRSVDLDQLAGEWSDLGQGFRSDESIRRAIAKRLEIPYHAEGLTPDNAPVRVHELDIAPPRQSETFMVPATPPPIVLTGREAIRAEAARTLGVPFVPPKDDETETPDPHAETARQARQVAGLI